MCKKVCWSIQENAKKNRPEEKEKKSVVKGMKLLGGGLELLPTKKKWEDAPKTQI